jgi:hydrogenase expression/formation protein HypD
MEYIDEYRDRNVVLKLAKLIRKSADRNYKFMEVCGGHTAAIHRFGIPGLLPENIRLFSGPGCPVCVTGTDFIDKAINSSRMKNVIVASFGDMIRVPGSSSSLEKEKASGADIRIVLSAPDALEIAEKNPLRNVIFLGIGFETTAPGTAATIIQAEKERIDNFYLLSSHRIMPPAMESIARGEVSIDGFICPGHVAAVTGSKLFNFIPEKYGIGCVVSGFEPADILLSILMLVNQVNRKSPSVEIQYKRAVTTDGNMIALKLMSDVFETCNVSWRGFGMIESSGLRLRKAYEKFDAERIIPPFSGTRTENKNCLCGSILKGLKTPPDCKLFADECFPGNPVGACMVSAEGSCNTWYRYKRLQ